MSDSHDPQPKPKPKPIELLIAAKDESAREFLARIRAVAAAARERPPPPDDDKT